MKLPCEMVQDLLPLYHDGVCSEVSSTLVGEHLADCEDCTRMLKNIDAEIEVPELEVEKAEPLVSIRVNWEKQTRKAKIKYIGAGVAVFFLCITLWWGLTQWCVVPLKANDYIIKEAAQLENGIIHIEFSVMYEKAHLETDITENGVLYEMYRHPILAKRRDQIPNGSAGVYFDPEDLTWYQGEPFNAYCLGDPDSEESILVWEVGMELPPASYNTEEEYRQMKDAYTAPNAPEEPDPLRVEKVEVESNQELSDNIHETVVSGTDSTENAK